jgi:hypothetical protein
MVYDNDSAVVSNEAAGVPETEIEITPEMIEAGVEALAIFGDNLTFRDLGRGDSEWLVMRVARAVLSAKKVCIPAS